MENLEPKKVTPFDLFKKNNRALEEIAVTRFEICKACPELREGTQTCKKCNCFMVQKVKLAAASCPLHKWEAVEPVSFK
jgi:hypothetical protein